MPPGAQLSPLPHAQGERVDAQRMKLPAMGGPGPPGVAASRNNQQTPADALCVPVTPQ